MVNNDLLLPCSVVALQRCPSSYCHMLLSSYGSAPYSGLTADTLRLTATLSPSCSLLFASLSFTALLLLLALLLVSSLGPLPLYLPCSLSLLSPPVLLYYYCLSVAPGSLSSPLLFSSLAQCSLPLYVLAVPLFSTSSCSAFQ